MKNHSDNIKNEIAYFYKVIKNMDIKDCEISLEEIVYDSFSDDFDMDKCVQIGCCVK